MATATGAFHLIGKSGHSYTVSAFFPDTAGLPVRFNQGGVADTNSPYDWTPNEPVALVDIIMNTNVATPTAIQIVRNGQPTGDLAQTAVQLASITTRPALRIAYGPMARMGAYMR
jgi:hypothetical protein